MSTVYESVVDVFAVRFGIEPDLVRPEASLEDLGLDSLAQIELATALQKRLGVMFTDDEVVEISRVDEVVAKLKEKGLKD